MLLSAIDTLEKINKMMRRLTGIKTKCEHQGSSFFKHEDKKICRLGINHKYGELLRMAPAKVGQVGWISKGQGPESWNGISMSRHSNIKYLNIPELSAWQNGPPLLKS